jgi:hypothetical protein
LQPDQLAALKDDAKNEQVCLLKSLVKLLVDHVEAACAKQGRGSYLALTAPHTSASSQDQTLAPASMKVHVDKQCSLLDSSSYGHVLYVILWNEIMTDTFNHVLNHQNWQTKCGAPEFQLDTKTITENHELMTCMSCCKPTECWDREDWSNCLSTCNQGWSDSRSGEINHGNAPVISPMPTQYCIYRIHRQRMQNNALEEQQPRKNCMRMEGSTTAQVESLTLSSFYVQQHSASHEQRKGSTTQLQEPNRQLKDEIQIEDLCPFEGGKENRKGTFLPSTVNSCRPDMAVEPSPLLSFAASW